MPFEFTPLKIGSVTLVTPVVFGDNRGFFEETYRRDIFRDAGIDADFVQDNHSFSRKGVVRGMHWQKAPHTQGKLISVITGTIHDVAVDIRKDSGTYGQWVAAELSDKNHQALWIPPGFAHGFAVLSETAHIVYKCTDLYVPELEANFRWDDPDVAIDWPVGCGLSSAKDDAAPFFKDITPL